VTIFAREEDDGLKVWRSLPAATARNQQMVRRETGLDAKSGDRNGNFSSPGD